MSTGKSIHIGLNRVDPACYGGWNGALAGCINDATAMQDIADSLGYSSSLLTDADATAGAVIEAISRAASELSSGDILFLTYSGHGGQVDDANGDEDEGQDETWVLYDRQVVDDELYQLYSQFADGVRVVILSDSCHSGTVAKVRTAGAYRTRVRDVPGENAPAADEKPRNLPLEVQAADQERQRALYETVQFLSGAKSDADIRASVLLISGCQDNQLSYDGPGHGRFTAELLTTYADGAFGGDYAEFHRSILQRMPPDQSPNLFTTGTPSSGFEAQTPFTIAAPDGGEQPAPGPDPDPVPVARPTLRRGDSGEHVEHLQERLVAHGHDVDIDGYFGPQVTAAVQAFQRARGADRRRHRRPGHVVVPGGDPGRRSRRARPRAAAGPRAGAGARQPPDAARRRQGRGRQGPAGAAARPGLLARRRRQLRALHGVGRAPVPDRLRPRRRRRLRTGHVGGARVPARGALRVGGAHDPHPARR